MGAPPSAQMPVLFARFLILLDHSRIHVQAEITLDVLKGSKNQNRIVLRTVNLTASVYSCFQTDSMGQVNSSPLGSPTSHRGMHPSLLSPTSMGPSGSLHSPISTLSSPMNGLASPFSVISSPMGPHSMNSPGMGYGASVSPQVRHKYLPQPANSVFVSEATSVGGNTGRKG